MKVTLFQNVYSNGVTTHSDIFTSTRPVVLSRERRVKVGALQQKPMVETTGAVERSHVFPAFANETDRLARVFKDVNVELLQLRQIKEKAEGKEKDRDMTLPEMKNLLGEDCPKPLADFMEEIMTNGYYRCLACHPNLLAGKPQITMVSGTGNRVGAFPNSAPYMPYDQHVLFMRNDDAEVLKNALHITQIEQIRGFELYYLLQGCVNLGKKFAVRPFTTTDLPRMVAGLNIGPLAGQSLPHIHAQYGWEIVLDRMDIPQTVIKRFFEEISEEGLMIHSEEGNSEKSGIPNFKLIAPWTPRGQFALDLFFTDTYEIQKLTTNECKLFGLLGNMILQKYSELGIKNMNIVFDSSPHGRRIMPVTAHFVPRVNQPAIYELLGRDVVDTPPETIFNTFVVSKPLVPNWRQFAKSVPSYDPAKAYDEVVSKG